MTEILEVSRAQPPKVGSVTTTFIGSVDLGEAIQTIEIHVFNETLAPISISSDGASYGNGAANLPKIFYDRVEAMAKKALEAGVSILEGVLTIPRDATE